ncbi:MAG: 4Fe-4S binding protein, partial [Fidelibacterota bacterium]
PVPYIQTASDFFLKFLKGSILTFKQTYFQTGFWLGIIFIAILAANRWVTRFWCRGVCPLGALLGIISRYSIFGLEKKVESCGECSRCLLHCQGGDDPIPGARWMSAECHMCFNCTADCPDGVLEFKFFPAEIHTAAAPDLNKRAFITSAIAGAAVLPLLRINIGLDVNHSPLLVRPPGSVEEKEFLERCIRCGECMKICPTNGLHPTFLEAGFEGIWSPRLIPRVGYCEFACTLCGQVCPTGAIEEITIEQKMGIPENDPQGRPPLKPVVIGTAFIDRGRCLPWAMDIPCIVCEEWCPTSPKAVWLEPIVKKDRNGKFIKLRRPHVDPETCVGCGACEYACPVVDEAAIKVTSVGETRSRRNRILLQKRKTA